MTSFNLENILLYYCFFFHLFINATVLYDCKENTYHKQIFLISFQARYTGFRDRPLHERQAKFQQACREGQIELAILSNGFTFCLMWNVLENGYLDPHAMTRIDFSKERGRVSTKCVHQLGNFVAGFPKMAHKITQFAF